MAAAAAPSPRRRERVVERDSVLRASILDTALELGIGDSNAVAKWMFSPVQEADEEVESMASPSLTYASTATSEESSFYASNFRHHRPGAGASGNSISSQANSLAKSDNLAPEGLSYSRTDGLTPEPGAQRAIHFDLSNNPEPRAPSPMPRPATPSKSSKLRKARPDGYESDGGYVSESGKGKKEKEKEKKEKKSKKKSKEDGNAPGEESDGGYLSEISLRRKNKDKKSKKDKEATDKTVTDGESDGGYISMTFGRKKKDNAAAKAATFTSPTTGDDSDGAYLSESSVKKRNKFFRLNSKSRKKASVPDVTPEVPPVPSLPPMQLKIADMFAKSTTSLLVDELRADTPVPSARPSIEPVSSTASTLSLDPPNIPVPPPDSPKVIPNAFKDAESIRSPSTDLLATFGRRQLPPTNSPVRVPKPSLDTISTTNTTTTSSSASSDAPPPTKTTSPLRIPTVPMISMPKPKRNPSIRTTPPQISAPNTRALAAKHTPVPLILTPPTPAASMRAFGKSPSSSSPLSASAQPADGLFPWNRSPDVPRSPSPSPVSTPATSQLPTPTTQHAVRPHVLAYYDLPPPSPPPSGPLPKIPPPPDPRAPRHDWSQQRAPSPAPIWKTDRPPSSASASPARSHTNGPSSPLFLQRIPTQRGRESPFPVAMSPSPVDDPFARIPNQQRGRESPFPTRPVRPISPSLGETRPLRIGTKTVKISAPLSADAFTEQQRSIANSDTLDAHWQPRSASALESRPSDDSRRSWIDYDDVLLGHQRSSSDDQDQEFSQEGSESLYHDDPDASVDQARQIEQELQEGRSTQYYDAEESDVEAEGEGSRYSVWSTKSRVSIMDKERSNDVRQKFVQRVEAMYGKSVIPPVPKLPPPKPGMF